MGGAWRGEEPWGARRAENVKSGQNGLHGRETRTSPSTMSTPSTPSTALTWPETAANAAAERGDEGVREAVAEYRGVPSYLVLSRSQSRRNASKSAASAGEAQPASGCSFEYSILDGRRREVQWYQGDGRGTAPCGRRSRQGPLLLQRCALPHGHHPPFHPHSGSTSSECRGKTQEYGTLSIFLEKLFARLTPPSWPACLTRPWRGRSIS